MPRRTTRNPVAQRVIQAFGTRLRRLRLAAGLLRVKLANRSDLSAIYVQQMEAGVGNPTLMTLTMLSVGFGCEITDLVRDRSGLLQEKASPNGSNIGSQSG